MTSQKKPTHPDGLTLMNYQRSDTFILSSSDQCYDPTKPNASIAVFFKVRDRVKKATFKGQTMEDLNQLLLKTFSKNNNDDTYNRPRTPISHSSNQTQADSAIDNALESLELNDTDQKTPTNENQKNQKNTEETTETEEKDLKESQSLNTSFGTELYPLYIVDRTTRLAYELDDVCDLYENCVLEMRFPGGFHVKRKTDIVYTGMSKEKLVFVLVGLPARGKSYISRRLARYYNWLGVVTKIFNVGQYRRQHLGAFHDHRFFDPDNVEAGKLRQAMAVTALDDMLSWLHNVGRVAVFDATNTTKERRRMVADRCLNEGVDAVFIENICNDPRIINANIREVKISSPDYTQMKPDDAVEDFIQRIKQYERSYEPIGTDEDDLSYIQLIDIGEKIIANRMNQSYLARKCLYFLGNLHIVPRPIWLCVHAESEFNAQRRMGGNSGITARGERFAKRLSDYFTSLLSSSSSSSTSQPFSSDSMIVWTGRFKAAQETAKYLMYPKTGLAWLDDLDFGQCDGLTYDEMAQRHPQEYMARVADKLSYQFPHGESYEDVIQRLEPVIEELERQKSGVLVISSLPIIRALYAYFMEKEILQVPYIHITQHTLIEITPKAYGSDEKIVNLDD